MAVYGYIRVSTREQNEDRQLIALYEVGVAEENIYIRTSSRVRILKDLNIRSFYAN